MHTSQLEQCELSGSFIWHLLHVYFFLRESPFIVTSWSSSPSPIIIFEDMPGLESSILKKLFAPRTTRMKLMMTQSILIYHIVTNPYICTIIVKQPINTKGKEPRIIMFDPSTTAGSPLSLRHNKRILPAFYTFVDIEVY